LGTLRALAKALLFAIDTLVFPAVGPCAAFDVAAVDSLGTVRHRIGLADDLRGTHSSLLLDAITKTAQPGARDRKANDLAGESANQESC
jgi:hypothetical protein